MRVRSWVICLSLLMLTAIVAQAQHEFRDFPEFRYTSALPGGGWGVTPDGMPGFDGAMQLNVPVAYTPHRGLMIGYSSASYDASPQLDFGGSDSNGTGWIALGLGKSGHGLFLCEMLTGNNFDDSFGEPAQNFQFQLLPETEDQPALAVGMVDMFNNRSQYTGAPHSLHNTASTYLVATKQFGEPDSPVYASLGFGWGRFNDTAFGGVSWRADERVTLLAEYDGWNVNAAAAYDLSSVIAEDTTLFAGLVDLDRTVIGLSYVYKDLAL